MESQLPKIAIIGRPNVGKSTLFNRLIGRRQAIVDDIPGVTRDRQYATSDWGACHFTVIDTGGFISETHSKSLEKEVKNQSLLAIAEADTIIFVVDGRTGLTPTDEVLAAQLRQQSKPVILAVNKIDAQNLEANLGDFYRLGFRHLVPISAETSRGISGLLDTLVSTFTSKTQAQLTRSDLKLAIVGRPNVGKSTLLNALLGEERAVVHQEAGTTRDPLNIILERGASLFEFVDTAGIRRRAQTEGKLEKVSVLKALKTIDKAHLALVVIDATQGMTAQDAKVLSYAEERGKGMLLVLNKWDAVPAGTTLKEYQQVIREKFKRIDYVPMIAVSAKTGRNVSRLFEKIDQVYSNYSRRVGTGELNRIFQTAIDAQPPPTQSGQNVSVFYATQTGWAPPTFVVFCNRPKLMKESYLRYLERVFRKKIVFEGAPIRWVLRKK